MLDCIASPVCLEEHVHCVIVDTRRSQVGSRMSPEGQRASGTGTHARDSKTGSAICATEYGSARAVVRHGRADVAVPLLPRQVTPDDGAGSSDPVLGPQ